MSGETHTTTSPTPASVGAMIPFAFEGAPVRVVQIDGEPHFVGKDVAERLGYANATKAMNDHCRGVTKRYPIVDALGRDQEARVLSEPDVLRLIVKSNLPAAERFERFVFEEVLPTIRRTGSYGAQPVDPMTVLNDPAAMRGLLLGYTEKVLELEAENATLKPAAAALERIAEAHGTFCRTTAAKMLGVPPQTLCRWMRTNGWTFRRPGDKDDLAYQSKINAGLLDHKVNTGPRPDGTEWSSTQVRVTPKGLTVLAKAFPPAVSAA